MKGQEYILCDKGGLCFMGQFADVVKDPELTDVSEELSMLSSLAQAKLDLFKTEIEALVSDTMNIL